MTSFSPCFLDQGQPQIPNFLVAINPLAEQNLQDSLSTSVSVLERPDHGRQVLGAFPCQQLSERILLVTLSSRQFNLLFISPTTASSDQLLADRQDNTRHISYTTYTAYTRVYIYIGVTYSSLSVFLYPSPHTFFPQTAWQLLGHF